MKRQELLMMRKIVARLVNQIFCVYEQLGKPTIKRGIQ